VSTKSENWPEFPAGRTRDNFTLNPATTEEQLEADWDLLLCKPEPTGAIPRMSQEQLKKFVLDFMGGFIFTSAQVRDPSLLSVVFMPLALGALSNYQDEAVADIGLVWAYLSEAIGSRAIDSYPFLGTCRFMHKDDWAKVSLAILREQERQDTIEV